MKKLLLLMILALGVGVAGFVSAGSWGNGMGSGGYGYGMGPGMMGSGFGGNMMGSGYGNNRGYMMGSDYGNNGNRGYGMPYDNGNNYGAHESGNPITQQEAKAFVANYIGGNPNLKSGKIKDRTTYFETEILTKDNSLVSKLAIDKRTGAVRQLQ